MNINFTLFKLDMMKKILLSALISAASVTAGFSQWSGNTAVNNVISSESPTATKSGNVAVSDGAGGMFVAWIDSRNATSRTIYVQGVNADGSKKFTNDIIVSDAIGGTSSQKSNLVMIADGAGGAIMVWQDQRNRTAGLSNDDIYGQRINASGNRLWATDGVRLTVADNSGSNKTSPEVALVNATEAIIVFPDNRVISGGTANPNLHAQKINIANGATVWTDEVAVHGDQPNNQTAHQVRADGSDGVFIVWQDPRAGTANSHIYAQRINNSGALLWGTDGTAVCTATNNQLTPQMVSDGAGGIVIVWGDQRLGATDADIFGQRLNSAGAIQWTADGELLAQAANNQTNPYIIPGGSGYIVVWSDQRLAIGNRNIFAQSFDNNGAPTWTTAIAGGVPVTQATGNQPNNSQSGIQLLSDGSNGAYVIWEDARAGSSALDIYTQRLTSTGAVATGWVADGNPLATAANNQQGPNAIAGTSNNVLVAWRDSRNGTTNGQLFASSFNSSGALLPLQFLGISAVLADKAIQVKWNTANEENVASFNIQKSTDGRNFSNLGSVASTGRGDNSYSFLDNQPVAGINYYRIQSVDIDGKQQYSRTVAINYQRLVNALATLYPNPARSTVLVQLSQVDNGQYTIRVVGINGVVVRQQPANVRNKTMQENINVAGLAAGQYSIQLVNAAGRNVMSLSFQKQ